MRWEIQGRKQWQVWKGVKLASQPLKQSAHWRDMIALFYDILMLTGTFTRWIIFWKILLVRFGLNLSQTKLLTFLLKAVYLALFHSSINGNDPSLPWILGSSFDFSLSPNIFRIYPEFSHFLPYLWPPWSVLPPSFLPRITNQPPKESSWITS